MRHLIATLMLAVFSVTAAPSASADTFNEIFASTCMQYFYKQEKIPSQMESKGYELLPNDQAEFFLGSKPGKAWIIVTPEGRFVVSLRDDSICSVFAQKADPKLVQTGFIDLVETAPEPLISEKLKSSDYGPNNEDTSTFAYMWLRAKDTDGLLFVLTTSTSDKVTAQAMASISLAKKAN